MSVCIVALCRWIVQWKLRRTRRWHERHFLFAGRLDQHLRKHLSELGVHFNIVDEPAPNAASRHARFDRPAASMKKMSDSYCLSEPSKPDYPLAYGKFASGLIHGVGKIDCLVGALGSGGSMCGTSKFLTILFSALYAIGVDTRNSILLGRPSGRRLLSELRPNAVSPALDRKHFDELRRLTAAEALHATHQLLNRRHRRFMPPPTGTTYKVGDTWLKTRSGDKVATIFPDKRHCYIKNVYNEEWLSSFAEWLTSAREEPLPTEELTDWSSYACGRRTLDKVLSRHIDHEPRRSVLQSRPDPAIQSSAEILR